MRKVRGEKKPANCPNCHAWMLVEDTPSHGDDSESERDRWFGICDECQSEVGGPRPDALEPKSQ